MRVFNYHFQTITLEDAWSVINMGESGSDRGQGIRESFLLDSEHSEWEGNPTTSTLKIETNVEGSRGSEQTSETVSLF